MEFTEEIISKIEKLMGFELYPWQKKHLQNDFVLNNNYRNCGNSTIYAIKKLLTIKDKLDVDSHDIKYLIDYLPKGAPIKSSRRFIERINDRLVKGGFETCLNIDSSTWFNMEIEKEFDKPTIRIDGKELNTKGIEFIELESGEIIILNQSASEWFKEMVNKNKRLVDRKSPCVFIDVIFPWNKK